MTAANPASIGDTLGPGSPYTVLVQLGHCEHAKAIHPFYRLSMQAPLPIHLSVTIRDVADPAQKRIAAYGYDGQAQCPRS